MPQYGSSQNLISTNLSQTVDNQGNPIISSDTGFAASPLGYAARAQALFGLPNATFDLTPPDTTAVISAANPLPYWDIQDYSSAVMSGSAVYDSTTNSWGVKLDPGTAASGDYLTMTTRSYLINDDNLSLRQQALVVVSKNGTYSSTTQWNLNLVASYYDSTNTLLHSGTVATIYDNTTWTSMAGTTTTGGTAISAAAHYVDLTFTLTATAAVTSATSVTIKSCLLQTSTGTGGGAQSFLVTDTFTTSGTWVRPTGVDYLTALILVGGGGGGQSGYANAANGPTTNGARGGAGGGGGGYLYARDVYVGGAGSFTITIGAGGSGGAGSTVTRGSAAQSIASITIGGAAGSNGGTTFFGTAFYAGPGGAGGTVTGAGANDQVGLGGTFDSTQWGAQVLSSVGGTGGGGVTATYTTPLGFGTAGGPSAFLTGLYSVMPYQEGIAYPAVGGTGGVSSVTRTGGGIGQYSVGSGGVSAGPAGYFCNGGAGGGGARLDTAPSPDLAYAANGGSARSSGGAGGGGAMADNFSAGTVILVGGTGGNAAGTSASGGGGGGGVQSTSTSTTSHRNTSFELTSGAGGNGAQGYAILVYIA